MWIAFFCIYFLFVVNIMKNINCVYDMLTTATNDSDQDENRKEINESRVDSRGK